MNYIYDKSDETRGRLTIILNVTDANNQIIAKGSVLVDLERGEIDMISVSPKHQGHGTVLLRETELTMIQKGYRYLRLRPLEHLVGFYERRGYYQTWFDRFFTNVWIKRLC